MKLRLLVITLSSLLLSGAYFLTAYFTGEKPYRSGFIDTEGRFVIKPQFRSARAFSEGIAWVQDVSAGNVNPMRYTAIDKSGRTLFSFASDSVGDFHCGLAKVSQGQRFGFINRKGKFVIPPELTGAEDFCNGESVVFDAKGERKKIDTKGNAFDYADKIDVSLNPFGSVVSDGHGHDFFEPSKLVSDHQSRWGVFSEGLCHVSYYVGANGRCTEGFMDRAHRMALVLPLSVEDCGNFHEGLAPAVFKPGYLAQCFGDKRLKLGYIDRRGAVAIPAIYDEPANAYCLKPLEQVSFHDGLALVYLWGVGQYINHDGKVIARFPNAGVQDFSEGRAVVTVEAGSFP